MPRLAAEIALEQCHRRAVQRGERGAQLVRDRGHELGAELVESPLAGHVAEGVDDAVGQRYADDREPHFAPVHLQGHRLGARSVVGVARPACDRHPRGDRRPAGDRLGRRAVADRVRTQTGDRLGRRVPEPDHAVAIHEEDAVSHAGEHPFGLLALLLRNPAASDGRRDRVGHGQKRRDDDEAGDDHAPAGGTGLRVDEGAGLERDEPRPARRAAESLGNRPIAKTARRDVRGARRELPGIDPPRALEAHEFGAAREAEPLVLGETDAARHPADERAAEREKDDDFADPATLREDGDVADCGCGGNRAVPAMHVTAGIHSPGEHPASSAQQLELHSPLACLPARGRGRIRDEAAVDLCAGIEAADEPRVGVRALPLDGIASEPPGGDGERRREEEERGDEPIERCVQLHLGGVPRRPQRRGDSIRENRSA